MQDPDEFFRINSTDKDKKLAALLRGGQYLLHMLSESVPYQVKTEQATSTVMYVGYAPEGTLTSEAQWQIARLSEPTSGNLSKTFANRTSAFDKVWDDRATYTYD